MRRDRVVRAALLPAAFAVLAVLVATGATTAVDQDAVERLMPGLYPYVAGGAALPPHLLASAWNPGRVLNRAEALAVLPARIEAASVLVVLALALSRRTGRAVWAAAYASIVAVEVAAKHALVREPLHTSAAYGSLHVSKLDASFPSGEAARAVFLAGLLATAWPALRLPALLWAAAVCVLLVAAGTHTPSDVAGGILLAAGLVVLCRRARPEAA